MKRETPRIESRATPEKKGEITSIIEGAHILKKWDKVRLKKAPDIGVQEDGDYLVVGFYKERGRIFAKISVGDGEELAEIAITDPEIGFSNKARTNEPEKIPAGHLRSGEELGGMPRPARGEPRGREKAEDKSSSDTVTLEGGITIKKDDVFEASSTDNNKLIFDIVCEDLKLPSDEGLRFEGKVAGQLVFFSKSKALEGKMPPTVQIQESKINNAIRYGQDIKKTQEEEASRMEAVGEIKSGKVEIKPDTIFKGGEVSKKLYDLYKGNLKNQPASWKEITWKIQEVSMKGDKMILGASYSEKTRGGEKTIELLGEGLTIETEKILAPLGATKEIYKNEETPFAEIESNGEEIKIRPGMVLFEKQPTPKGGKAPEPKRFVVGPIYERENGDVFVSLEAEDSANNKLVTLDALEADIEDGDFSLDSSGDWYKKELTDIPDSIKFYEKQAEDIRKEKGEYAPDRSKERAVSLSRIGDKMMGIIRSQIKEIAPGYEVQVDSCTVESNKDNQLSFKASVRVNGGGLLGKWFGGGSMGEAMIVKGGLMVTDLGELSQAMPVSIEKPNISSESLDEVSSIIKKKGLSTIGKILGDSLESDSGGRPIEAIRIKNGELTALLGADAGKYRSTSARMSDQKVKDFINDAKHGEKYEKVKKIIALENNVQEILNARKQEIERREEMATTVGDIAVVEARMFQKNPLGAVLDQIKGDIQTIDAEIQALPDGAEKDALKLKKINLDKQFAILYTYLQNQNEKAKRDEKNNKIIGDKPIDNWVLSNVEPLTEAPYIHDYTPRTAPVAPAGTPTLLAGTPPPPPGTPPPPSSTGSTPPPPSGAPPKGPDDEPDDVTPEATGATPEKTAEEKRLEAEAEDLIAQIKNVNLFNGVERPDIAKLEAKVGRMTDREEKIKKLKDELEKLNIKPETVERYKPGTPVKIERSDKIIESGWHIGDETEIIDGKTHYWVYKGAYPTKGLTRPKKLTAEELDKLNSPEKKKTVEGEPSFYAKGPKGGVWGGKDLKGGKKQSFYGFYDNNDGTFSFDILGNNAIGTQLVGGNKKIFEGAVRLSNERGDEDVFVNTTKRGVAKMQDDGSLEVIQVAEGEYAKKFEPFQEPK